MNIIKRLAGEIERNQRIADQLERGGLRDSDAARTARSNLRHANRELAKAQGKQEGRRHGSHP